MTTTVGLRTEPDDSDLAGPSRDRRWRVVAGAAVAVALIAVVVAVFAVRDDNGSSGSTLRTSDVAAVQQLGAACQQWMGAASASGVPSGWCGQMTGWMYDRMASGGMRGSMMWASAETMRSTCTRAMSGYHGSANDVTEWCQSMVAWMSQHAGGNWRGWMMNPSMMGR